MTNPPSRPRPEDGGGKNAGPALGCRPKASPACRAGRPENLYPALRRRPQPSPARPDDGGGMNPNPALRRRPKKEIR